MHTLQVECSNKVYEHLMFFLQNLPKEEAMVYEVNNVPNEETFKAMEEIKNRETIAIENFDDYLAQMNLKCTH